ncbi:MAG: hypothetical protein D8M58_09660 [Calditrichaeota bacterium]|nr:MAG: hypothetical protein DWQ03_09035 [Calditrichota bacterium]MBL1205654.1 hypothetical protein [Calditrichota bacterium]NOG45482.1 hypothetical protein [Calditrichota bacterium]
MPGKSSTIFIVLLIIIIVQQLIAQDKPSVVWHGVDEGEWTKLYLKNSLFPHSSRQGTHTYKELVFTQSVNYSDSSAVIFIPRGYKTVLGYNDVIVHFHGWNNEAINVMHDFDLLNQLYNSEKNAILVVAQGPKNAMDSAGGKIEERNGLKKYIREILSKLKEENKVNTNRLGQLIISSHSGGYRPAILGLVNGGLRKNIKELYLFDSFYSLTDMIVPWLKADKDNRLRSIYTENLEPEHQEFLKLISANGMIYNNVLAKEVKIILRPSKACHDCIMDGNFEQLLKISLLNDIDR